MKIETFTKRILCHECIVCGNLYYYFQLFFSLEIRFLSKESQVLRYLENRLKVHKDAINFCQDVLRDKPVEWEPIFRNDLSRPISDVDLIVTVGGDGTLLQASHFIDDSIPVIGVNSDPTQVDEVGCLLV